MVGKATNIEGTLHVDRYLTGFSVAYIQSAAMFVASKATSLIRVNKQTDKYVVYDRGYFWRDDAKERPLGARPQQTGYKLSEGTYNAREYALEHTVDDRQRENADDPIDLDENATRLLTQKNMIRQDRFWANTCFKTGVWSTDYEGVQSTPGSNQFLQFDDASSDPIGVVDEVKDDISKLTGFKPNTLVLGTKVKRKLRSHADIADRIKYTQTGIADEAILASLFDVDTVVTARSVYNAANQGSTDDFNFIVDETAMWLGYIDPNPSIDSPTAAATFAWTGLIPGATNTMGGVIETGRDDRAHSDYFQGRMAWDIAVVAADLGAFFNDVVAA
jgi:hypothetical protein